MHHPPPVPRRSCNDSGMVKWVQRGRLGDKWTLIGNPVEPVTGRPLEHVWYVQNDEGTEGVAKRQRSAGAVARQRFQSEVSTLRRLAGEAGILPLLDLDSIDPPAWFVTEQVDLLGDHHQSGDLREVVESFAELAETLERIHSSLGLVHRDLKPANLFWKEGHALLGDFGLVHGPDVAGVTEPGIPIGSVNFLAPEARQARERIDWVRCDVYSLALCLWSIAADGQLPPPGTLWVREETSSLYEYGGKASDMLAMLLEKCTAHRSYARPSMKEFATELRAWLDCAPPAKRQARHHPAIRTFGSMMEARVHAKGITGVAQKCLIELLWAIDDRLAFEGSEQSPDDSRALLADEDLAGGNPDWVPEWGPEVRTLTWASHPSVRLVAALIGTNDDRGVYWVEWHTHDAGRWDLTWHSVSAESWLRMPTD